MNVKRFIDLHIHIGPEIFPRRFTAETITKEEIGKIKGLALKNHFYPTMPMIKTIKDQKSLLLIGSVVLNNSVGGLNPEAVDASAKLSKLPIIVWFPTIHANNFLKQQKYEIPPEWVNKKIVSQRAINISGISVINKRGKLSNGTIAVLEAIKRNKCVLATGHLSWYESVKLIEKALEMNIKKIIVTHPIYQPIDMPIKIQKKLVSDAGVYAEQSYSMYLIDKIPIEKIAEQINRIGAKNCVISSDMGQILSPSPSEGLQTFVELLTKQGISENELRTMGEKNPRKLLGIESINI